MGATNGASKIFFVIPKGLTSGAKEIRVIVGPETDTTSFTIFTIE
jgi:hypothetical protein